jgi:dihydrofolate reductase
MVSNLMSLDGFFEGPNRQLDWHVVDEEFFAYAVEMLGSVDTILFGRTTFDMMAAYWPKTPSDPIADKMNGLRKIVFSNTLNSTDWAHSTIVSGDAAVEVARLKTLPGMDMVILGSARLASSLLRAGFIDEYRVIVNPVILGSGNRLFPNFENRVSMQLSGVRPFASGNVMLLCQPQATS